MKRRLLGIIACVVGLLGVVAAVVAFHVIRTSPPGALAASVQGKIFNIEFEFGSPPPPPRVPSGVSRDQVATVAMGLGCLAIGIAVASWIRRERPALGFIACYLGVAAIAWEWFLIVVCLYIFVGGPTLWHSRPWSEHRKPAPAET